MVVFDGSQEAFDASDRQLAEVQGAQAWKDLLVQPIPVDSLGAGRTVQAVEVLPPGFGKNAVNGQVRVAAGGQKKVPAPRLLLAGFDGSGGTCLGPGLAHAEGLSFGDHDDGVVEEAVEQADGGGVLGEEPAPLVEGYLKPQLTCPQRPPRAL